MKKLAKLDPTFHTRTKDSPKEMVTNLRPSVEKLQAVIAFVCPSRTYSRIAVFRSYMMTAPSFVPTASL